MIKETSGPMFFLLMGIGMLVVVACFCCIKKPRPVNGEPDLVGQEQQALRQDTDEQEIKPSFCETLCSTIKLIFTKKMMLINMMLIFSGVSIAFWSGMLTPIMVLQLEADPANKDMAENVKTSHALYAMSCFGVGEVFGGVLQGIVIDRCGMRAANFTVMLVIVVMTLVTVLNCQNLHYGPMSFLMTFLWGTQDGVVNIIVFRILGFEFVSNSEPFGVFNLIQGLAVFGVQLLQGTIDTSNANDIMVYSIICGVVGIISCLILFMFPFKGSNKASMVE